jgi:hypothetical protein
MHSAEAKSDAIETRQKARIERIFVASGAPGEQPLL